MLPSGYASHYARQVSCISENYYAAGSSYAAEAVHDFRVGVKRFRAFIDLIETILPGTLDTVSLRPLNRVYKASGKIRDAQVQLELIEKLAGGDASRLKELISYISRRELKGQLKLSRVQSEFSTELFNDVLSAINSAAERHDPSAMLASSRVHLQRAIADLYTAADSAQESQREFEELHEVRIQAKRVRYIVEILQTEDEDSDELRQLNKRLRGIHRALGMWHDAEVGLQLLDKFRRKFPDLPDGTRKACDDYAKTLADSVASGLKGFDKAWHWFIREFEPPVVA